MKSGTTELLKFVKLQRRLKESKRGVVGLLECLWLATAKNCPRGDIGRFSNEEIAILCDYEGDPDELVSAMIDCRWLDVDEDCRLIVHDWNLHAPGYIHATLKSRGMTFASIEKSSAVPSAALSGDPSAVPSAALSGDPSAEDPPDIPTKPSQAKPSLTKSSQAKPSQAKPDQTAVGGLPGKFAGGLAADEFLKLAEVDAVRRDANRLLKACPMVQPATLWQIAWIGCCLDPGFVGDMLERMRNPKEPIRNRQKYLLGSVRRELESRGLDVNDCLVGVPPPPKIVEKV